jgi:hypothetical protein
MDPPLGAIAVRAPKLMHTRLVCSIGIVFDVAFTLDQQVAAYIFCRDSDVERIHVHDLIFRLALLYCAGDVLLEGRFAGLVLDSHLGDPFLPLAGDDWVVAGTMPAVLLGGFCRVF